MKSIIAISDIVKTLTNCMNTLMLATVISHLHLLAASLQYYGQSDSHIIHSCRDDYSYS